MKFNVTLIVKGVVETHEPENETELIRLHHDIRTRAEFGQLAMVVTHRKVGLIMGAEDECPL